MLVKIKSKAQPDNENKLHLLSIKNVTAWFFCSFSERLAQSSTSVVRQLHDLSRLNTRL